MATELVYHGDRVCLRKNPDVATRLHGLYRTVQEQGGFKRNRDYKIECVFGSKLRLWMRHEDNELFAAHYPGDGGCTCPKISIGKGIEHQRAQDIFSRACLDAKIPEQQEFSLGYKKPRPDNLAWFPNALIAGEIEMGHRTTSNVKGKETRLVNSGALPLIMGPDIKAINNLKDVTGALIWNPDLDLTTSMPTRGKARALNLFKPVDKICNSENFRTCPEHHQTWCGRVHLDYNPLDLQYKRTLESAIIGFGERELVWHLGLDGIIRMVPADSLTVFYEMTGSDGLYTPNAKKHHKIKVKGTQSIPCRNPNHDETYYTTTDFNQRFVAKNQPSRTVDNVDISDILARTDLSDVERDAWISSRIANVDGAYRLSANSRTVGR